MAIDLKVLRVEQPLGEFYIGALSPATLREFTYVDVRRFEDGNPSSIEGIQRELSPKRVLELRRYVNFDYATFPTSVVLAVDERCATLVEAPGCAGVYDLRIDAFEDGEVKISIEEAAFVVDGQHRLAGLRNLAEGRTFDVNVSIFIGVDNADKAEIFSTVNLAQTKVNRSLVFDLFTYAKTRSPHRFAHQITVALNRDKNGPLHDRIKRLGVATPGLDEKETLSQATVVRGLLKHLVDDPDVEKNKGFLGTSGEPEPKDSWRRRFLLPFYRADDLPGAIALLTNYFSAVEQKWDAAWADVESGYILNRTNGYNALIRFVKDAYLSVAERPGDIVSQDAFFAIFNQMSLRNSSFTTENYPPGSSGESRLYSDFLVQAGL